MLWVIIKKDKLNGINFKIWYRNLRDVLKNRKKYVLDDPLIGEPDDNATSAARTVNDRMLDEFMEISCLVLAHMEPDLQL